MSNRPSGAPSCGRSLPGPRRRLAEAPGASGGRRMASEVGHRQYTTPTWEALCGEVAKLRLNPPRAAEGAQSVPESIDMGAVTLLLRSDVGHEKGSEVRRLGASLQRGVRDLKAPPPTSVEGGLERSAAESIEDPVSWGRVSPEPTSVETGSERSAGSTVASVLRRALACAKKGDEIGARAVLRELWGNEQE